MLSQYSVSGLDMLSTNLKSSMEFLSHNMPACIIQDVVIVCLNFFDHMYKAQSLNKVYYPH
jgi:hypothetical protein